MKAYRLKDPIIINGQFVGRQVFHGPVEGLEGLTDMESKFRLVVLEESNGDPTAINPADVSRVERLNATRSRIRFISGGRVTVLGSVLEVRALLESQ